MNFTNIKLLVCDFDGVMTDNTVLVDQNGKESVLCNRSDGLGIERLKKAGVEVMVLSKEQNPVVLARCKKLDIGCIHGVDEKLSLFKEEAKKRELSMEEVCFIGNDVNDIACIKEAGIGVAVADAYPDVVKVADHVTKKCGGKGAVREICDLIAA